MFDRLVATLRALADGISRPTASSCSGDPIAWEKDWTRRRREANPAAPALPRPDSTTRAAERGAGPRR